MSMTRAVHFTDVSIPPRLTEWMVEHVDNWDKGTDEDKRLIKEALGLVEDDTR